jgi:UDP-3-O-[3-hydroxymyristoyl] glucosamine N-acyltransferase
MKQTSGQIAGLTGGQLIGSGEIVLESVASLKNSGPRDLTYAERKFHVEAAHCQAGCILATAAIPGHTVIVVKNPKLAFTQAAAAIIERTEEGPPIHPSAVIGANVRLGADTRIGAGCVVGRDVTIGSGCVLHPRVVVYAGAEIGNRVILHAGSVIGADGFGYVKDGERYVQFPQLGRVVIEDDVEIGANTTVDRGSLENTIIRRGVKIDNLVQIAHNVEIGEHTVIAAQTGISGSTKVGPHSIIGGQVGIGENARLDAHTILGGQAGVLNNKHVHGGEVLWGTPARPLKEFLEQQAHLGRLPQWMEELKLRFREKTDS